MLQSNHWDSFFQANISKQNFIRFDWSKKNLINKRKKNAIGNITTAETLLSRYNAIIETFEKEKTNNTLKGDLIKSSFITSTMGVSYKLKLGKNI